MSKTLQGRLVLKFFFIVIGVILILLTFMKSIGLFQAKYIYIDKLKIERPVWSSFHYLPNSDYTFIELASSIIGMKNVFLLGADTFSFAFDYPTPFSTKTIVVLEKVDKRKNAILHLHESQNIGLKQYVNTEKCIYIFEVKMSDNKKLYELYGTETIESITFFISGDNKKLVLGILENICTINNSF